LVLSRENQLSYTLANGSNLQSFMDMPPAIEDVTE